MARSRGNRQYLKPLLREFKALNDLLSTIHEVEMDALVVGNLSVFQELQSIEQKARDTRVLISNALQELLSRAKSQEGKGLETSDTTASCETEHQL